MYLLCSIDQGTHRGLPRFKGRGHWPYHSMGKWWGSRRGGGTADILAAICGKYNLLHHFTCRSLPHSCPSHFMPPLLLYGELTTWTGYSSLIASNRSQFCITWAAENLLAQSGGYWRVGIKKEQPGARGRRVGLSCLDTAWGMSSNQCLQLKWWGGEIWMILLVPWTWLLATCLTLSKFFNCFLVSFLNLKWGH